MPRFGVINERRHQLHEVIRLSGMNLIIDDTDHPLIIKVASISAARMQVYFIDNDEYFKRKSTVVDEKEKEHKDNDERSMFFCRGVLETVKKLGWQPDIIYCNGWMTALMPMYLKNIKFDGFNDDVLKELKEANFESITKSAVKYSDGLCVGSEELTPELKAIFDDATCDKLEYVAEEHQVKEISEFLDKVIGTEVLI